MTNQTNSILDRLRNNKANGNVTAKPVVKEEPKVEEVVVNEEPEVVEEVVEETPNVVTKPKTTVSRKVKPEPVVEDITEDEVVDNEEVMETDDETVEDNKEIIVDADKLPKFNVDSINRKISPKNNLLNNNKKAKSKKPKEMGIVKGGSTPKANFEYMIMEEINKQLRPLLANELNLEQASAITKVFVNTLRETISQSNLILAPDMRFNLRKTHGRAYRNYMGPVNTYISVGSESVFKMEVNPGIKSFGVMDDEGNFYEAETYMDGTTRKLDKDDEGNAKLTGVVISNTKSKGKK